MPIVLSLAAADHQLYAAGPEGLFRAALDSDGALEPLPQPMQSLYCCATVPGLNGPVLLAGGTPHGAAFRPLASAAEDAWQAGWMDHTSAPVLQIAPAPHAEQSGVILAATGGEGILRSANRGRTWSLVNFGLRDFSVLALAWAPPPPPGRWPAREVVFAGSERGLYRSPAGGLGWKAVPGIEAAVQAIAVSPAFHEDGMVLAGTEEAGLWRSTDGGRSFAPIPGAPARVDALFAGCDGWWAGAPDGVYRARDGEGWHPLPDSPAALCFLQTADTLWAGGEYGLVRLAPTA